MPLLPKAGLLLLAAAAGAARAFDIRDLYSGAVKGDVSPCLVVVGWKRARGWDMIGWGAWG